MFFRSVFPMFLFRFALWTAPAAALPAPGLSYSAYLRDGFTPVSIATDAGGNLYLAGTQIVDPVTSQTQIFVAKLDPQGVRYLYTRTLGGSVSDTPAGMAVDAAGNAFITGVTMSPDFPVTPGRRLGTAPANARESRAFLIKLDPQGSVVFSEVIGSVNNSGQAVALTAAGEILISGASDRGFAATPGAYSVPDTLRRPYLMKLDAAGSQILFTATGIGGSALALDAAGNIYMAGSTTLLDYPTTPGAYQSAFGIRTICYGLCQISFFATSQYVTKVDPSASRLIYSTPVAGSGQTTNRGLAVDASGNVYLTGLTYSNYPYTVPDPGAPQVRPFLTKLDPAGAKALYSVPIGGTGVALGSHGEVYAGGSYDNVNLGIAVGFPIAPLPAGVASLPAQCRTNNITTTSQGYISQIDGDTGNILGTVLIDGTNLSARGIALARDYTVWLAGSATQPDTPITPGAPVPAGLKPGPLSGAYLGQADFSLQTPVAMPHLACVLDAANLLRAGPVAPNQILSLFGAGLGPDNVTVTFDAVPATVLYASSSQINVVVPYAAGLHDFTVMSVSVGGLAAETRQLPVTARAPSLFSDLSGTSQTCQQPGGGIVSSGFLAVARNQDGTLNSCAHPATPGAVVSFFLNGVGGEVTQAGATVRLSAGPLPIAVRIGQWSAEVVNVAPENDFVWRVDARVPQAAAQKTIFPVSVALSLEYSSADVPVTPLNTRVVFWVSP